MQPFRVRQATEITFGFGIYRISPSGNRPHCRPPAGILTPGFSETYISARATGVEPATTGSTVRYSNQLSYAPKSFVPKHLRLLCFGVFGRLSSILSPEGRRASYRCDSLGNLGKRRRQRT